MELTTEQINEKLRHAFYRSGTSDLTDFIKEKVRWLPSSVKEDLKGSSATFAAYVACCLEDSTWDWKTREYHDPVAGYLYYDSSLWRLIDVPEDVQHKDSPVCSLQYIGPVNDGTVPSIPESWYEAKMILYRTWAGVSGLRKVPGMYKCGLYQVFDGCDDFDAFEDIANAHWMTYGSGWSIGRLYDGVSSPKLINSTDYTQGLAEKFGVAPDDELWQNLSSKIEGSAVYYSPDGHRIRFKHITKASEIDSLNSYALKVVKGVIITSRTQPPRLRMANVDLYFIDGNFVNDTEDVRLFSLVKNVTISKSEMPTIKPTDSCEIEFMNDCTVTASAGLPCIVTDSEKLTIKGHGTTLRLKGECQQPCIGVATASGLSYGRWSIGYGVDLEEIVLEDINVICETQVPNFALGTYGKGYTPKLTLRNASIECPEKDGRVMKQSGFEDIYGSTKTSQPAVYELSKKEVPHETNNQQ